MTGVNASFNDAMAMGVRALGRGKRGGRALPAGCRFQPQRGRNCAQQALAAAPRVNSTSRRGIIIGVEVSQSGRQALPFPFVHVPP